MQEIKSMLEGCLDELGLAIYDVEFIKEGSVNYLRIAIDKEPVVDLDDCVAATHIINEILDEKDPIKEKYILEVCSRQKGGNVSGQ